MKIQPAEKADHHSINEILTISFDPIYAFFAKRSLANLSHSLVSKEGNIITGIIKWKILQLGNEKINYLYWLAVHPSFRQKGIGKSLILNAMERIQSEGKLTDFYAAVKKTNETTKRLIESLGFRVFSRKAMKDKFGWKRFQLYVQMNLAPKEDLYRMTATPRR